MKMCTEYNTLAPFSLFKAYIPISGTYDDGDDDNDDDVYVC